MKSRYLIATGYWLAVLLLVLPLLERVVPLLPVQPLSLRWRVQALGSLSQTLLLPLLGVALAVGTAALLQQRRIVRTLALFAYAGALLLAGVAVLFALDVVQYQTAIGRDLEKYYRAAALTYLTCYFLGIAFLFWLGAVSWRAARRSRRVGAPRRPMAEPLVRNSTRAQPVLPGSGEPVETPVSEQVPL